MDRKKLVLLLVALIIAVGTAIAARNMLAGSPAPQAVALPKEPEGPKVLVAQRGLPVGTIITADAISYQAWPKDMVDDAYFVEGETDINKMLGTVVRQPITAGEPVTKGALVAPGDRGFLAAALGPGMRAVTVPVSARTGVGGFVFPGDRVDVMLTQSVSGDDGPALKVAETVLRNVRVLATDQSTESKQTADGKTVVRAFRTVTLEVTPRIAEKVAVAQTIGTLTLSLRSIADNKAELEKAIASGDVDIPAGASKSQEEQLLSSAISRPQDGATSFVTGGDVSRFQRRTLPRAQAPSASSGGGSGAARNAIGEPVRVGPIVRVTRGHNTEAVPVGSSGKGMVGDLGKGVRNAGKALPGALVTP
jgi:pilus assembly protein CpaB